jgi:hypothetical protein
MTKENLGRLLKSGGLTQVIFWLQSFKGEKGRLTVDMGGDTDHDEMWFILTLGDSGKVLHINAPYRSYEEASNHTYEALMKAEMESESAESA